MRKWWGVVIHRRQARRMREETKERQRDIGDIPQRVRERAQHVFPLSHSFRTAECSRALMLARRDVRRYYTLLYRVPRGKGVGRKGIWFISFFNNSLLFSSSLSVAATFWSIALDMSTTIHFYLRSDAGGRWDSSPFPLPSSYPTLSCSPLDPSSCLRFYFPSSKSLPVPAVDGQCVPNSRE